MLTKSKLITLTSLAALFITACDKSPESSSSTAEMSEKQKVSYSLGISFGMRIKQSQQQPPGIPEFDNKSFLAGLSDALEKEPDNFKLTQKQMMTVMTAYQQRMIQKQREMIQKVKSDGEAFLEKKKKEAGIKVDDSGILYKVERAGTGKSPTVKDNVQVHYRGSLIDGKEFDSSYKDGKPVTFNLQQMITAWKIMIPKMKEGANWTLYVPAKHAYGQHGFPPQIRPFETLVFNVELIKVNPTPETEKKKTPKTAEPSTDKSDKEEVETPEKPADKKAETTKE